MPSIDTSSTSSSSTTSPSSAGCPATAAACSSMVAGAVGSGIVSPRDRGRNWPGPRVLPYFDTQCQIFRDMVTKPTPGRPRTTSRDEVQRVALALFAERGFEETTLDDVAAAVGVSRRTLFRYYPSKNDIVWGEFGEQLKGLRSGLAAA